MYNKRIVPKITPIASGSKGNCTLVRSENTNVLVDIGIPLFYAEDSLKKLGVNPCDIDAVLVTHEHTDHISGVQAFCHKYNKPVYAHNAAAARIIRQLSKLAPHKIAEFYDNDFFVGDLTVSPFQLSHDAPCTGYGFSDKNGKISMLTDAGILTDALLKSIADSDIVLIEANHDIDMLRSSKKYPAALKRRILSEYGHLSNAAGGEAVAKLASGGVARQFILAHLSMENNYPELALSAVGSTLLRYGIKAGSDVELYVAEQYKIGKTIFA